MIKVYLNRKVSETQITIGNQYESGVNAIDFDLSELKEKWPNGNIYLLVSRKKHTWPYSIDDGEFKVEYVLTWKRGFYQMNVVVTDEKITDQLESSNTIFVSDTINAYVNENQINAKALNEQELPRELQIVYDDLITLKKNIEKDLADGKYIGPQGPKGEPGDVTEEYRNLASQIAQNASDAQTSATNAQVSATNAQKALDDTKDFVNQTKTELNQIKTDTRALKDEANTSAVNAQASATSAQESATNASQSATNASQSATSASQSATSAQESATNAQTSATSAQKILDDTKTFANKAKEELNQIKTDTNTLKEEANTSATNAKASEDKAKEYADNLKESTDAISQNTKAISELADKKITKFYASNQGETHVTDSDNGKIMDMMIYGKSSQDGEPSPSNPVEIKNVVNPTIKVIGKNLIKFDESFNSENFGITMIYEKGGIRMTGTATGDGNIRIIDPNKEIIKWNKNKYTVSLKATDVCLASLYVADAKNDEWELVAGVNINETKAFEKAIDVVGVFITFVKGETYDVLLYPQVEYGTQASEYEPYKEQSIALPITLNAIPVSSGGNVTIDGKQYIADRVVEKEGVYGIERNVVDAFKHISNTSIEIDATSNNTNRFRLECTDILKSSLYACICNILSHKIIWNDDNEGIYADSQYVILRINKSTCGEDEQTAKDWLINNINKFHVYAWLNNSKFEPLSSDVQEKLKMLSTYYPVTNITVGSEQLDGYIVFNYPISLANGWNYVKKQLNDNRDYIYDMDLQSAEAYVNSEYAVTLTELEV